jgi:predicted ATP-dependent serine protease
VNHRVSEAKKLGFTKAIAPSVGKKDMFISGVKDLRQALIDYLQ